MVPTGRRGRLRGGRRRKRRNGLTWLLANLESAADPTDGHPSLPGHPSIIFDLFARICSRSCPPIRSPTMPPPRRSLPPA